MPNPTKCVTHPQPERIPPTKLIGTSSSYPNPGRTQAASAGCSATVAAIHPSSRRSEATYLAAAPGNRWAHTESRNDVWHRLQSSWSRRQRRRGLARVLKSARRSPQQLQSRPLARRSRLALSDMRYPLRPIAGRFASNDGRASRRLTQGNVRGRSVARWSSWANGGLAKGLRWARHPQGTCRRTTIGSTRAAGIQTGRPASPAAL